MMSKEITLGDWLKGMGPGVVTVGWLGHGNNTFRAVYECFGSRQEVEGDTPEDALQALCEAYHRDEDALLDIGRSAKWTAEHGPDGVAGLQEGEAGVVQLKGGALHLLERADAKQRAL